MVQVFLLALLCVPLFWFAVFNPVFWGALAVLAVSLFIADRLGLLKPPGAR